MLVGPLEKMSRGLASVLSAETGAESFLGLRPGFGFAGMTHSLEAELTMVVSAGNMREFLEEPTRCPEGGGGRDRRGSDGCAHGGDAWVV